MKTSPDSRTLSMKIEDFLEIPRLEAHHLDRDWGRDAIFQIPLKIGTRVGGFAEARQVERNRVELSRRVSGRKETLIVEYKRFATRGTTVRLSVE
jgi:hypothetical protein